MAFDTGAQRSPTQQNDKWKADRFLNLSLPSKKKDGSTRKLGAISLKLSNSNEKELIEWLDADPTRVKHILSQLIIDYRSATPAEGSGFDLSIPG